MIMRKRVAAAAAAAAAQPAGAPRHGQKARSTAESDRGCSRSGGQPAAAAGRQRGGAGGRRSGGPCNQHPSPAALGALRVLRAAAASAAIALLLIASAAMPVAAVVAPEQHWTFDNTLANSNASGVSFTSGGGTAVGAATFVAGALGSGALHITNEGTYGGTATSYISVPYPYDTTGAYYTITFWMYQTAPSPTPADGVYGEVFYSGGINGNAYGVKVTFSGAGTVATVGEIANCCPQVIPAQTWVHVALVFNGAQRWFYVNGAVPTSGGSSTGTAPMTSISVGSYGLDTSPPRLAWSGYIDDLRLYTTQLSLADIQLLATLPAAPAPAPAPATSAASAAAATRIARLKAASAQVKAACQMRAVALKSAVAIRKARVLAVLSLRGHGPG